MNSKAQTRFAVIVVLLVLAGVAVLVNIRMRDDIPVSPNAKTAPPPVLRGEDPHYHGGAMYEPK